MPLPGLPWGPPHNLNQPEVWGPVAPVRGPCDPRGLHGPRHRLRIDRCGLILAPVVGVAVHRCEWSMGRKALYSLSWERGGGAPPRRPLLMPESPSQCPLARLLPRGPYGWSWSLFSGPSAAVQDTAPACADFSTLLLTPVNCPWLYCCSCRSNATETADSAPSLPSPLLAPLSPLLAPPSLPPSLPPPLLAPLPPLLAPPSLPPPSRRVHAAAAGAAATAAVAATASAAPPRHHDSCRCGRWCHRGVRCHCCRGRERERERKREKEIRERERQRERDREGERTREKNATSDEA